jgi:NTP pyrophosphatase (non-canonical NTP hydrolase)
MLNPDAWLPAVLAERVRQEQKWGGGPGDCSHPDTPDQQRLTVLVEEVGEVARAILQDQPDELRAELVQVAAVAAAWLEGLHAQASATPKEVDR